MWVRNQKKKELVKVSRFEVDREFVLAVSMECNDQLVNLGEYDSEADALKVLDKIQMFIEDKQFSKIKGEFHSQVFQMPE